MGYVQEIAQYIHSLRHEDVPSLVLERVRACWLYGLSQALASDEPGDTVLGALSAAFSAPGPSTVLISGRRRSPADAAALNAALMAARGQNDTHQEMLAHIGCVVVPAVLAIGQARNTGPRELLLATLAGYEVVTKIARRAASKSASRGFRPTSVYSVFGAAAACARAIGLTVSQTANALAIACNYCGGLIQCWQEGTPEWRLQVAHASQAGVHAALLAEHGVEGASLALEGSHGFYRAFAGECPQLKLEGWDILDVVFKPYPGCAFNQSSIHALRCLVADERIDSSYIASVIFRMNPEDAAFPGLAAQGPFDSAGGALMSASFMAAATLRDGYPMRRHFTQEYFAESLQALCFQVSVVPESRVSRWSCEVEIFLKDGTSRTRSLDSRNAPFAWGWRETVENLRPLASEWTLPEAPQRYAALSALLSDLERTQSIDDLLSLCTEPR